jgi:uncharacterized protein (DUF1800 family)
MTPYPRHRAVTGRLDPATAWQAYEPSPANPWDRRKVAHLYRRAAFGATWRELDEAVKLGPAECVRRLVEGHGKPTVSDDDFAAMTATFIAGGSDQNLQGTWLYRILASTRPVVERMVLFWHDHFATSQDKVGNLSLMHRQIELFRSFELGRLGGGPAHRFGELLRAISRDPAMLVWLDANSNRRTAPNENYARELMELFALGLGNYTEKDIQQAARAFTGWFMQRSEFRFTASEHDTGPKTVLGQTGNWDGDDVVRIVLEQPGAAMFLVGKLCRYFVNESEPIGNDVLAPLADEFRRRDYDVAWLVPTILRSNAFFSPAAFRKKIASPVDFVLGTARRLEAARVRPVEYAQVCARLGQSLYRPPNVAGWEEGRAWVNSSTVLLRSNFAQAITAAAGSPFAGSIDPAALAAKYGRRSDDEIVEFFLELLVDGQVPTEVPATLRQTLRESSGGALLGDDRDQRVRRLVQLVLSSPEYNLC